MSEPSWVSNALANAIFKESPDNFRVIVGDVGGGFGMKTQIYPEDAVWFYGKNTKDL